MNRHTIYTALAKCFAYYVIGDYAKASDWGQRLIDAFRDAGLTIK